MITMNKLRLYRKSSSGARENFDFYSYSILLCKMEIKYIYHKSSNKIPNPWHCYDPKHKSYHNIHLVCFSSSNDHPWNSMQYYCSQQYHRTFSCIFPNLNNVLYSLINLFLRPYIPSSPPRILIKTIWAL